MRRFRSPRFAGDRARSISESTKSFLLAQPSFCNSKRCAKMGLLDAWLSWLLAESEAFWRARLHAELVAGSVSLICTILWTRGSVG